MSTLIRAVEIAAKNILTLRVEHSTIEAIARSRRRRDGGSVLLSNGREFTYHEFCWYMDSDEFAVGDRIAMVRGFAIKSAMLRSKS